MDQAENTPTTGNYARLGKIKEEAVQEDALGAQKLCFPNKTVQTRTKGAQTCFREILLAIHAFHDSKGKKETRGAIGHPIGDNTNQSGYRRSMEGKP